MFSLRGANMFASTCFAVHYAPDLSSSLFGSVRGVDGSTHFQFQGQASLFSDKSTPEWDTLILIADQRTLRSILTTIGLEDHNRAVYWKSNFMFGDAVSATDQQLLV